MPALWPNTFLAVAFSIARAALKAAAVPEAMIASLPFAALTDPLEMGASRECSPKESHRAAMARAKSGATVKQELTTAPRGSFGAMPSGPNNTASVWAAFRKFRQNNGPEASQTVTQIYLLIISFRDQASRRIFGM